MTLLRSFHIWDPSSGPLHLEWQPLEEKSCQSSYLLYCQSCGEVYARLLATVQGNPALWIASGGLCHRHPGDRFCLSGTIEPFLWRLDDQAPQELYAYQLSRELFYKDTTYDLLSA